MRYPDFELLDVVSDIGHRLDSSSTGNGPEFALIESESKFRAVADTAASAIYIHAGDKFLYVNRASQ